MKLAADWVALLTDSATANSDAALAVVVEQIRAEARQAEQARVVGMIDVAIEAWKQDGIHPDNYHDEIMKFNGGVDALEELRGQVQPPAARLAGDEGTVKG